MQPPRKTEENRRSFIRGTSLLLAGAMPGGNIDAAPTSAQPHQSAESLENALQRPGNPPAFRPLRLGLVGCGYRGVHLAGLALQQATPEPAGHRRAINLTAMADVFPDRLQQGYRGLRSKYSDRVQVAECGRFVGLDGFRRLMQTDVDAVILAAPPVFCPEHFEAAVSAGKHVYCEAPIAVDAAGVQRFLAAVEVARAKHLLIATNAATAGFGGEVLERLRQGAVGELLYARAYRHYTRPAAQTRRRSQSEMEFQLRNWQHFQWASGGPQVLQQSLDLAVINSIFGSTPRAAQGISGIEQRASDAPQPSARDGKELPLGFPAACLARPVEQVVAFGDCADHYSIEYTYTGGQKLLSMCRLRSPGSSQEQGKQSTLTVHGTRGWCDLTTGKIYDLNNELLWRAETSPESGLGWFLSAVVSSMTQTMAASDWDVVARGYENAIDLAGGTRTGLLGGLAAARGRSIHWSDTQAQT